MTLGQKCQDRTQVRADTLRSCTPGTGTITLALEGRNSTVKLACCITIQREGTGTQGGSSVSGSSSNSDSQAETGDDPTAYGAEGGGDSDGLDEGPGEAAGPRGGSGGGGKAVAGESEWRAVVTSSSSPRRKTCSHRDKCTVSAAGGKERPLAEAETAVPKEHPEAQREVQMRGLAAG